MIKTLSRMYSANVAFTSDNVCLNHKIFKSLWLIFLRTRVKRCFLARFSFFNDTTVISSASVDSGRISSDRPFPDNERTSFRRKEIPLSLYRDSFAKKT